MWGQLISAGAGLVGGALGGGGGGDYVRPMEHVPEFLRPYYKDLMGQLPGLQTPEYFPGQTVADQNPWMQQSLAGMGGWGSGMGGEMMNAMYGGGMQGLGAMQGGLDMLNSMSKGKGFRYGQNVFNRTMNNLTPGMQGQFDAAMRDPIRQFEEQTIPGINMAAAGSGQGFGTRADNMGQIAQRGLQDRAADTASGIWQNAANQAQAAAMNAGQMNLQNKHNILDSYGKFGQLGADMMGQGYDMGVGNLGLGFKAGQHQQGYDQSLIDAAMKRHNFEQNAPWLDMQTRLGMMPSPGGAQQGTQGMTPFEGAMQGVQAGLGIYGMGKDAGWWGGGGGGGTSSMGGWDGSSYGYW